jgi:hypothetical protein
MAKNDYSNLNSLSQSSEERIAFDHGFREEIEKC